ncbi:helix-turn-helix transcriptional regulator [Ursidibacter arcticus]
MEQSQITLSTYSTLREVSQLLQADPTTIKRWSKAGKFPRPIQIGRTVRYKTAEIQAFLEQHAQEIN